MEHEGKAIFNAYWVISGRFLAGKYPYHADEVEAEEKIRWLLDNGINFFLDLTEAGEYGLEPYAPLLLKEAAVLGRDVIHRRISIPDMSAPTPEKMTRILDTLDAALEDGRSVYLHCYGGIGRTGTVVGCYLVRHGMDGVEALKHLARLRAGTPDGYRQAPETQTQRQLVLNWA